MRNLVFHRQWRKLILLIKHGHFGRSALNWTCSASRAAPLPETSSSPRTPAPFLSRLGETERNSSKYSHNVPTIPRFVTWHDTRNNSLYFGRRLLSNVARKIPRSNTSRFCEKSSSKRGTATTVLEMILSRQVLVVSLSSPNLAWKKTPEVASSHNTFLEGDQLLSHSSVSLLLSRQRWLLWTRCRNSCAWLR